MNSCAYAKPADATHADGPSIVILSHAFAPSIGGIETVSSVLAQSLAERGYRVTVVTHTAGSGDEAEAPFGILRRPGAKALIALIRQADLVLQSNISLRMGWPLWVLFPQKPFILVHHTPIARASGRLALQDRLKRALLWRPYCLSVSRYLSETLACGSQVIRNPYDNTTFRRIPALSRDGDLLFVGRLVPAKGVDILLRALPELLCARPQTTLTIAGAGPQELELRELAKSLGIQRSVSFLGARRGHAVAELMNRHKILVVPSRSRPPEACPVVPIEAIACGCVPVGSRMGGLPESIGEAGVHFEEENSGQLAAVLARLLDTPELLDCYRAKADEHLREFKPEAVVDAYESHFTACGLSVRPVARSAA